MTSSADSPFLVCPVTKKSVTKVALADVPAGDKLVPCPRTGHDQKPIGVTPEVLLREDGECAYPIVDGIPILMRPEMLVEQAKGESGKPVDLTLPRYDEAYAEMDYYNGYIANLIEHFDRTDEAQQVKACLDATDADRRRFPQPVEVWLDAMFDSRAQFECYSHLAPTINGTVVQIGGRGSNIVRLLMAGIEGGWLLTPMIEEARFARRMAEAGGVHDRLRCVVAVGEEIPFADETMDGVYSGGCVHHMDTRLAMREFARILRKGGRFAAADPWKVPVFHELGTRVLGKREVEVHCRPMTKERIQPMFEAFSEAKVVHFGALSRYPLLALSKLGIKASLKTNWRIALADDAISSLIPPFRRLFGSSIAMLATK